MAAFAAVLLGLLVCLAFTALWSPIADIPDKVLREGAYPAPEWFSKLLQEQPRTLATDEQREVLQRDGVVLLRGVLRDAAVLNVLRVAWGTSEARVAEWYVNGVLRSLVRDGPLGALAASALNGSAVRIFSTSVFTAPGGHPGGFIPPGPPDGGVHMDIDSTVGYVVPLLTVWLALTDARRPLEFLPGSHRRNLERDCPYGPGLNLSDACVAALLSDAGGERRGWDVRAGDVVAFFSQTYHWTVLQAENRTALSLRFVAADQRMDFQDYYLTVKLPCTHRPRWCAPMGSSILFPVVYPREDSTVDAVPWPVHERRIDALCRLLPAPQPQNFGRRLCSQ